MQKINDLENKAKEVLEAAGHHMEWVENFFIGRRLVISEDGVVLPVQVLTTEGPLGRGTRKLAICVGTYTGRKTYTQLKDGEYNWKKLLSDIPGLKKRYQDEFAKEASEKANLEEAKSLISELTGKPYSYGLMLRATKNGVELRGGSLTPEQTRILYPALVKAGLI